MGSDFLFATPSMLGGISKMLDFGATSNIYNGSNTAAEADYRAIKSDWTAVGDDIRMALDEYEEKK